MEVKNEVSFSAKVKSELCRNEVEKGCCALAEALGTLLYANTFAADCIRVVTECRDFALRLPRLFRKALGVEFPVTACEKHELSVTVKENYLVVETCGQKMTLRTYDLKEGFHLGIDACEGINRFYDIEITEAE